jgi:hypothetical protein
MKTLLEEYEEEGKGSIAVYEERVVRIREKMEVGRGLIKMIEPLSIPIKGKYMTYDSIRLEFSSIRDTRKIISEVLEKTTIEKFVRASRDAGSELKWDFTVDYKGVMLSIGPATPSKDCVAVVRINTYSSWVCEKREGG